MAQPIRKPTWSNLDAFGLMNGLAIWDDNYTKLLYIRKPFETNLDIRDRILRSHDYRADITKQGIVNAINAEFNLTPYNATKKTIFELSFDPIPSGSLYVQDISGFYQDVSGNWQSIGPQIWSQDYDEAKTNKVGFLVWQKERFSNIPNTKNYSYSNIVEVLRELNDDTELKFEYYVEVVDEYNISTLQRFTDLDNPEDKNDIRFNYRKEDIDLSLDTNAIVYNLNDIPYIIRNLYYDENGYPTEILYKLRDYINNKFNHTWDKIVDKSCIWDVHENYGSGQIPSFYDALVPENYFKSSIDHSGYIGGIESLSYSLYPYSIETDSSVDDKWYLKLYPGNFYIEGIPFYYFESPVVSGISLGLVTDGTYSGLYSGIIPSGLTRGAYTIAARSGYYDDTYYCNFSRDTYLSGIYEDANYNTGFDGDKIWSDIYQRKACITTSMGFQTEIPIGRYVIDFNSNRIYVRVPDSVDYSNLTLIYETALTPSGSFLTYDLNPLNEQNLSLEKFFMFLTLAPNGIYYNNLRP